MRIEDIPFDDFPQTYEGTLGAYKGVVEHWLLRLLLRMGLHLHFNGDQGFRNDDILKCLDIEAPASGKDYDNAKVLKALKTRLEYLELNPPPWPTDTTLARQLAWFAERVAIAGASFDILHFTVLSKQIRALEAALDAIGMLRETDLVHVYATTLGLPRDRVASALAEDSSLGRSGILWINPDANSQFSFKVIVPEDAVNRLGIDYDDPMRIFRGIVLPGKASQLTLHDYPHLSDELVALRAYLVKAMKARQKGVNVLVYGPPGTGKTELARALAEDIGAVLHEVPICRPSGAALSGGERLRCCRLAQSLLGSQGDAMILFDEAEDVFNQGSAEQQRARHYTKSWFNQFLESNNLPTFWLVNSLWVSDMGFYRPLDSAYLRRFDVVLKVDVPPRNVRQRILESHFDEVPVNPSWIKRMAEHDELAPALVQRTARVMGCIREAIPEARLEATLDQLLGNTLEAMGYDRKPRHYVESNTRYRLDCLNVDIDLDGLCQGLSRQRAGRMCLYGPPGTGKTAFGRYLAERLDMPILIKRVSDLVSPWLGETEKKMAQMFSEAKKEKAILLLDEVDSFLRDRKGAVRSWEVTEVNEMLTQMENFEGIFIASTNLMEDLDQAAMRRFDVKLYFDYLRSEQVVALFTDAMHQMGMDEGPNDETLARLHQLTTLTPGDFSVVLRRAGLARIASPHDLVMALGQECKHKQEHQRRPVGFLGWGASDR